MFSEGMLHPKPSRTFPASTMKHMASFSRAPECDETVACQELGGIMRRKQGEGEGQLSPECGRQFVTPPLSRASMASTCVGLSPRSSLCLSPALDRSCSITPESGSNGVVSKQIEVCGKGQRQKTPQVRKIFVGGIPRDMDQKCLQEEFSKYGGVNKAWMQKARESGKQDPHRGFGFVIFHEAETVDHILGGAGVFSRFIVLQCGVRVEVKRAIGSREMVQAAAGPEIRQGCDNMTAARAAAASNSSQYGPGDLLPPRMMQASSPAQSLWSERASLASPVPRSPPRFSPIPAMEFVPRTQTQLLPTVTSPPPSWAMTDAGMAFSKAPQGSQQEPCTLAAWTSPEMLYSHASNMYGGRLELALMEAVPDVYDD
eukprot:TRINITY_DN6805_c0_g1_i1.p1 TRINITY_DN6805_c0_g1~~TRINITY_DN6805_c0_g1_i1.p1  ORF type:complete len:372 (-),score=57.65 TRINITY_DN6805_c0_g1_i1:362-1477(-)